MGLESIHSFRLFLTVRSLECMNSIVFRHIYIYIFLSVWLISLRVDRGTVFLCVSGAKHSCNLLLLIRNLVGYVLDLLVMKHDVWAILIRCHMKFRVFGLRPCWFILQVGIRQHKEENSLFFSALNTWTQRQLIFTWPSFSS